METNNLYATNTETTFYGRILQEIMSRDGFSSNIIEIYNNEVMNKIPDLIKSTKIPVANGEVTFENVELHKPHQLINGKRVPIYPSMARSKTTPYFSKIEADMVFTPSPIGKDLSGNPIYREGDEPVRKNMILGEIPAMLGSELCHLSKKGMSVEEEKEERMKVGECFNDPLGYFIIKSERVIITQENLRNSAFLVYQKSRDSNVEGNITCPTNQGTTIVRLIINKHSCIKVLLQHLNRSGYEGIPLFLLFRMLGFSPDRALERIYEFVKPEHRNQVYFQAQASIAEFQAIPVDTMEGYINYVLRIREKNDPNKVIREEQILRDLENDLFTNITGFDLKITHLAMYSAKMFEYMIGERKLDDLDSWANKQLITAGYNITKLFKCIWWSMISSMKTTSVLGKGLKAIDYKVGDIGTNFESAFGPNGWGLKSPAGQKKENITDSLKRETPLSVYSQIAHVNTPTSRQSKTSEIRAVHPSQLGYMCLYDSPEGDTVGLVKNLACTCYISLERDINVILLMLKEGGNLFSYITQKHESDYQVPLLLNGVLRAWCKPDEILPVLYQMRRSGVLYKDMCIFKNPKDNTIELYCDGGRPTRPLFVMNQETQNLVILEKKLTEAPLDRLIREGCIEYVDAREQEYILLCQTMNEMESNRTKFEMGERYKNYSHCEIDPYAIFSISASLVPMAHRQNGPRTSFQAGMFKQALGQFHSNEHQRYDTSFKMIYYPTKAIFQNDTEQTAGLNFMPTGTTLQVAILAHPDNPEDGIVFKEEAVKYGNIFDMSKKITITSAAKSGKDFTEHFERPPIAPGQPEGRYAAIDESGFPKLDSFIRQGDCVLGKVRRYNKDGRVENISEYAAIGGEGYIDRILVTNNSKGDIVVRIKIRKNRKYIAGDKAACTTPDHSVLTLNRGWVPITDVAMTDNIATLNAKQELEYQKPEAVHHYSYEGPMYSIQGQQINQIVTPEHRMYIKKRDKTEFELDTVTNVFGKRVNYKKNAINTYPEKEFFEVPQTTYSFNGQEVIAPAKQVPMDDWLIFLGIWLGDGWVTNKRACIAANKPRVKEALDRISGNLGFEISKCKGDKWYIHDRQYGILLEPLSLGASKKYIPDWCFTLSQRQSRILIEGLMLSDGHKTVKGTYNYFTSSPKLAEDVQKLALHSGWSANANVRIEAGSEATMKDGRVIKSNFDAYIVKINRTKNEPQMNHGHSKTQNGQKEEIIQYKGSVHCITVPNGIFYTQRNGIPSWTGNSRYSQKGTVSKVIPSRLLPRVADGPNKGMVPDILINPHGQPSRMTINKIIEIKTTKAALIVGKYINSTTFRNFEEEMEFAEKTLGEYGLDIHGKENFELPNGVPLRNKVFFGPCYYQALRHHVSDKIQMRARGSTKPDTRQPVSGRSKEGGLRVGEMERDALISHGSSALLRERMCDVSDAFNLPICGTCGTIAIINHITKVYTCKLCGDKAKFGIIRIPYATKLLLHYLNASGIHMTFKVENMFGEITRMEEKFLE